MPMGLLYIMSSLECISGAATTIVEYGILNFVFEKFYDEIKQNMWIFYNEAISLC